MDHAAATPTERAVTTRDGRDARWEQHREQRREALVDATIRAVRNHGAGVGMDDIAAEAGTSKTVIYRHFEDKAGLYRPLADDPVGGTVDQVTDKLTRLLLDSLSSPTTDPATARTWAIALVGSVRAVADDWL